MIPLPSYTVQQWNFDATTRYFHKGRIFFIGLTLRYLGIGIDGGSVLVKTDEVTSNEAPEIRIGGIYAVPHVGVRIRVGKSMTMSFDLGLQLAFFTFGSIHSSRLTSPMSGASSSIYQELDRAAGRPLAWLARTPLPAVSLFALSWDL